MSRRNASRTDIAAVSERVTAESPSLTRNETEPLGARLVARINNQIQCPVQGHRSQVPRAQANQCASRIAGGAIDALRLMLQRLPFRALMWQGIENLRVEVSAWKELRQRPLIRLKKRFQI